MRIALTADLHLTTREEHPERYEALEDIFQQMLTHDVCTLVIAGDLFQSRQANLSDFDMLCSSVGKQGISVLILPGNHDQELHDRRFVAENVQVMHTPRVQPLSEGGPAFLFVPFQHQSMGEAIAPFADQLAKGEWILVSHGDFVQTMRAPNPLEPGIYMPLTERDLQEFRPRQTFLGHIHMPVDEGRFHYMGSPCSLDPTETGRRRFLIYDTASDQVESCMIRTGVIFFLVDLLCLPGSDEVERLKQGAARVIESWALTTEEQPRVRVRIRIRGYSMDPRRIYREIKKAFKEFALDKDPDLSALSFTEDPDRSRIFDQVKARVEEMDWPVGADEPDPSDILEAALKTIYGD